MGDLRTRRSLLNFGVLIIFAVATTVFVLREAGKAIEEIDRLSRTPIYLGVKDLDQLEGSR